MSTVVKDLGAVTAYADAVAAGYTGTKEEWQTLMASYASVAEEAQEARDAAIDAKEGAEDAVDGFGAVVTQATNQAVQTIRAEGTTQVGNVSSEGTTQVAAVQAKGTEVIQSIPADYTQLSSDVTQLKEDLQSLTPLDIYVLDTFTPSGELTNNYAWNVNGSPTSGTNYHYKKFDLTQIVGNTVTVSGTSWGVIWPLISFYKSDSTLISSYGTTGSTSWNDEEVTVPAGTNYAIVNGSNQSFRSNASLSYTGKTGETQQTINEGFTNALQNYIPKLYTLQDAFVAWMNGEKFPIAFYGDSTTDGWRTTGWTANTLGSDHTTGYLYTDVLQAHLRECCNNSILRVYNAGFTGQSISWAVSNFEAEFINSGVAYSDVKMIGISFGINDAIGNKTQYTAFKNNLITLIKKCISNNIQPFLVTTQATYEADPTSRNEAIANHSYANQIKKEVAKEYGLELIDTEAHTGRFLSWSTNKILDIIPDTCHFADAGHKFEGGMYFWQIVPRTIYVDEGDTRITPLTVGITSDLTWRDGNTSVVLANAQGSNKYKLRLWKTRTETDDIKMLDAWVYLNRPMTISPWFGTLDTYYVLVDGVTYTPSSDGASIGTFDMGLHHVSMMSGASTEISCYGFTLELPT